MIGQLGLELRPVLADDLLIDPVRAEVVQSNQNEIDARDQHDNWN